MLLWGNGFWFTYFHPINKFWTKSVRVCVCYVPLAHISYIILVLQNICRWWNVTNRIPQFSKEKIAVVKIICYFFMNKRQKITFWLYLCHWYWPFIIFEIEMYNSFLLMTVFQSIGSQRYTEESIIFLYFSLCSYHPSSSYYVVKYSFLSFTDYSKFLREKNHEIGKPQRNYTTS